MAKDKDNQDAPANEGAKEDKKKKSDGLMSVDEWTKQKAEDLKKENQKLVSKNEPKIPVARVLEAFTTIAPQRAKKDEFTKLWESAFQRKKKD